MVAHGVAYDAVALPGLVAEVDGEPVGLLTYDARPSAWEVVTIDAVRRGGGVGAALLSGLAARARAAGAERVWLITTNDNTAALQELELRLP